MAAAIVLLVGFLQAPVNAAQADDFDVYTTPGTHSLNGRQWKTSCEPYSQTRRCRTEIMATVVTSVGGTFVQKNGWVFNNLTYVASPRSLWRGNPLAGNGQVGARVSWKAADGRQWRTECDTSLTGGNGCRSFVTSQVIESRMSSSGNRTYQWVTREVFNNLVRFSVPPPPGWVGKVDVGRGPADQVYWGNWGTPDLATYAHDGSGNFVVMSHVHDGPLRVDTFNPRTLARVGPSRTISLQGWPEFGGVYAAPGGDFYLLLGRDNSAERTDVDVVAVRRYSPSWQLMGTAYLKGGAGQAFPGITVPFRATAPEMLLVENRLIVHMSREMFKGSDGLNHQSNLTFEVDTATMKAQTFEEAYGLGNTPYVSHSFNNFVTRSGDQVVFVDHGDAYPRSIVMHVFDLKTNGWNTYDLLNFNGTTGDNNTGTSMTGVKSSGRNVLVVGNSVDHKNAPNGAFNPDHQRNVFAISADALTGKRSHVWLTSVSPTGQDVVSDPRMVSVSENRFALMFTVTRGSRTTTEYRLMDGSAQVLAKASFTNLPFPAGAEPIKIGSQLMWLTAGESPVDVFALDISDPARPKLPQR